MIYFFRKNSIDYENIHQNLVEVTSHPFLTQIEYIFTTSDNIYLIMKHYSGGELSTAFALSKSFKEEHIKFYSMQIALALGHLHSKSQIYRDLRPESILIDKDGYIALSDYGIPILSEEGQNEIISFFIAPEYTPPEVIKGLPHNKMVDWWAFGILLYELSFGITPFYAKNLNQTYQNICLKNLTFPIVKEEFNVKISHNLKDLITKLLNKNPEKRIGKSEDYNQILQHEFFAGIDKDTLLLKKIIPTFIPFLNNTKSNNLNPENHVPINK